MYYFYLLKSQKTGKLYKGHCENIPSRLAQHNSGKTKSTSHGIPWSIIYTEEYQSRAEAIEKEKYYKTLKGAKELLRKLSRS